MSDQHPIQPDQTGHPQEQEFDEPDASEYYEHPAPESQQPSIPQMPLPPSYATQQYQTPFANAEMTMPKPPGSGKAALWAVLGAVGAVVILAVGFLVYKGLGDSFRTLDSFPTEKYLSNHESVIGSRFRVDLVVDAELGGSFDKGRLLAFRDADSQRTLAVLVSPELSQVGFSKGQNYIAEIEVREGGLIYAHAFKKN